MDTDGLLATDVPWQGKQYKDASREDAHVAVDFTARKYPTPAEIFHGDIASRVQENCIFWFLH